jgi:hypothetical protein
MARRHAQPDPAGQLGDGQPAVLLKGGKNLPVKGIHEVDSSKDEPLTGNT